MDHMSITEIAEGLGLSIESVKIAEHDDAFRVYKGAGQVFVGTEAAVREFLSSYENDRPGLYEGSMYGYKE